MRFDWIFYIGHYKDLRDAGIDNEEKAREHWRIFGQFEGRLCNPEQVPFNWHYYLALNEDLEVGGIHTKEDADEHWLLYGKREGRLCRPECKILCVVAVHLDSYLKIDTLINNIPYLNEISTKVIIIASELPDLGYRTGELREVLDTVEYYVRPNDPVRVCYDKYQYYLENNDYSRYDRVILTNDSYYIFRPLAAFRRYCLLDKDCISFSASNERSYHLTDYLRCYSQKGVQTILNHFRSKQVSTVHEAVQAFEVDSTNLFQRFAVYRHAIPGFNQNIMFDDAKLSWAVLNQGLEVIKLKGLTRVSYSQSPADFDPVIYKYLNPDLRHLTDKEAIDHFNTYGLPEGRPYKSERLKFYHGLIKLFELAQFEVPISLTGVSGESPVGLISEDHDVSGSSEDHDVSGTPVVLTSEDHDVSGTPVVLTSEDHDVSGTPVGLISEDHDVSGSPVVLTSEDHDVSGSPVVLTSEALTSEARDVSGTPVVRDETSVELKWSPEEDEQLRVLVATLGKRRWGIIAQSLKGRDSKQCRDRWDILKPPGTYI